MKIMCKATSYTHQLLEIYSNINSDVKRLTEEVRTANLFNIDMLHEIMNTKFNACEGYKLAKQIQDNQLFRQQSKCELTTLIQLRKFINANINSLNQIHLEIIDNDTRYKYNIENKVYNPKVINTKTISEPEVVDKEFIDPVAFNSEKRKVASNPVQNIPKSKHKQQELSIVLGDAIHKKTNVKMKVISKIDDGHYLVKVKNGYQVICSKHIVSLEGLQSAK